MLTSERTVDTRAEKITGQFLDKYLYSRIRVSTGVIFERIQDRKRQLDGIDIIVSGTDKNICIDEKVQCDYINKNLPTNCFEISFLSSSSEEREGWFVNDDLKTTHYLIVWPFADFENENKTGKSHLTLDNITKLQCILISKAKLLKFLETQGITKSKMKYIAEYMRSHEQRYYKFKNQPFHFTYTQTKVEKPINIIIQKTLLLSLACRVYDVTKDELITLTQDDIKKLIINTNQTRKF